MAGIPIDQETIERFQNESFATENGHAPEAPTDEQATQQLNEAMGWLLKTADSALKNVDERLATEQETSSSVSTMRVICFRPTMSFPSQYQCQTFT